MINIIKADLYKYCKRPFLYILASILLITSISMPLLLKSIDETVGTRINALNILGSMIPYISIFVIVFASVLSEEYYEHTLKNTLPCNISKSSLIMGKFIMQILICIVLVIMSLSAFILTLMFLNPGEGYTTSTVLNFSVRFLSAIPIYIAGIAVVDFFMIIFKNDVLVYIFYIITTLMLPSIFQLMEKNIWSGFKKIGDFLCISALQPLSIPTATNKEMCFAIVIGVVYIIVFSIINIVLFSNQEIK